MNKANMPISNVTSGKQALGSTHSSKMAKSSFGGGPKVAGKHNMPANNVTDKKVTLGNTKHGVGTVPGYLKG